jgi:energy-coupling factor transport system ATP-binding protein
LLLDEPTRGLDYGQKAALAAFLAGEKARGRTVVMATHDVELVASCADRVILLGDGQVVVDGPARQVMAESLVFSSQINKLFRDPELLTVEDALRWFAAGPTGIGNSGVGSRTGRWLAVPCSGC